MFPFYIVREFAGGEKEEEEEEEMRIFFRWAPPAPLARATMTTTMATTFTMTTTIVTATNADESRTRAPQMYRCMDERAGLSRTRKICAKKKKKIQLHFAQAHFKGLRNCMP